MRIAILLILAVVLPLLGLAQTGVTHIILNQDNYVSPCRCGESMLKNDFVTKEDVENIVCAATNGLKKATIDTVVKEASELLSENSIADKQELNQLARDHISFLTNKLSWVSGIITIFITLITIGIPIFTTIKFYQYNKAFETAQKDAKDAIEKVKDVSESLIKERKRTYVGMGVNHYFRLKYEQGQYSEMITDAKFSDGLRRSVLSTYCLDLIQGLNCSFAGDDHDCAYRQLLTMQALVENIKTAKGSSDMAVVSKQVRINLIPSIPQLTKLLGDASIKMRTIQILIMTLQNFLDAAKIKYNKV